jgi:hypothetical protein
MTRIVLGVARVLATTAGKLSALPPRSRAAATVDKRMVAVVPPRIGGLISDDSAMNCSSSKTQQLLSDPSNKGKDLHLPYEQGEEVSSEDVDLIIEHFKERRSSRVNIRSVTMKRSYVEEMLKTFSQSVHLKSLSLYGTEIKESGAIIGVDHDEIDKSLKEAIRKSSSLTDLFPATSDWYSLPYVDVTEIETNLFRNRLVEGAIKSIGLKILGARLALTFRNNPELGDGLSGKGFKISDCDKEISHICEGLIDGLTNNDILTISGRYYSPIGDHILRKISSLTKNASWPSLFGKKSLQLAEFPDYEIEVVTTAEELVGIGEENKICIGSHVSKCLDNQHVMLLRNVKTGKVDSTFRCVADYGEVSVQLVTVAGYENMPLPQRTKDLVEALRNKISRGEIPIDFVSLAEARAERMRCPTFEERLSAEVDLNVVEESPGSMRDAIKGLVRHCSGGEYEKDFSLRYQYGEIKVSLSEPDKFQGYRFKKNVLREMLTKHTVEVKEEKFTLTPLVGVQTKSSDVEARKQAKRESVEQKATELPSGLLKFGVASIPARFSFRDTR